MDTSTMLVGAIPLMVIVFGLVEFSKKLGAKGNFLTILSMVVGLAFGMLFRIYSIGVPVGFAPWFEVIVYGLAIGLVASGFYDFVNNRLPKTS
jgi:hypothetical protein